VCLLPLGLAAYVGDNPAEAVWLNAPGWSRARLVGVTQSDEAVPIALDDAGGVYLFLVQPGGTTARPRVIGLNRDAEIAWERTLDPARLKVAHPQLLWDGHSLRLFWLDDQRLYAASLDTNGDIRVAPAPLPSQTPIDSYAAAPDGRGHVALWYAGSRARPGAYASWLGDQAEPAALVDAAGYRPALRVDGAGTLHAAWSVATAPAGSAIYYAAYPGGQPHAGERRLMATVEAPNAESELEGPWFGTDSRHGYLLWTILRKSGMNAGRRTSQYVSFPLDQPTQVSEIRPLAVPDGADLAYDLPRAGELEAGPRVSLASNADLGGVAPTGMSVNAVAGPELALACEALVRYRYHQTVGQIGVLFFRDGAPADYQLLSFNESSVFTPALSSDSSRQLYVTWRDIHRSGSDVYFASTAPDITRALSRLSASDLARLAVDVVFGMLSGAIFAPFAALLWLAAPLAILGLTWFTRRESSGMRQWGTIAGLALAIGAYWAGKLIAFGAALSYVPFSAWLPALPPWLALPLQVGVPALIALGALRLAWGYTYRAGHPSAVMFMLIYGGVDSIATMAIYGGLLFDAFYPHGGG
jgi:hypothetical protein